MNHNILPGGRISSRVMFDENNYNNDIGNSNIMKRPQAMTSSLLQCHQDIDHALRSLRDRFNDLGTAVEEEGGQSSNSVTLPDPTRLISRLTALETSISFLKSECQSIEAKRNQVVQSVLMKQKQNMERLTELMEKHNKRQLSYGDSNGENQYEDVWNHVVDEMSVQAKILSKKAEQHE